VLGVKFRVLVWIEGRKGGPRESAADSVIGTILRGRLLVYDVNNHDAPYGSKFSQNPLNSLLSCVSVHPPSVASWKAHPNSERKTVK
jgi:hypothetical protein